jgi:U3 small nucleolar RNA-associated protein 12
MVKAYLRYEPAAAWGVIASAGGCAFDATGKLLATACLDRVGVWSLKQGAEVRL